MPQNELYKFLYENKHTEIDEKTFLERFGSPEKSEELRKWIVGQKNIGAPTFEKLQNVESLDSAKFYNTYFKKKEEAGQPKVQEKQVSGTGLKTAAKQPGTSGSPETKGGIPSFILKSVYNQAKKLYQDKDAFNNIEERESIKSTLQLALGREANGDFVLNDDLYVQLEEKLKQDFPQPVKTKQAQTQQQTGTKPVGKPEIPKIVTSEQETTKTQQVTPAQTQPIQPVKPVPVVDQQQLERQLKESQQIWSKEPTPYSGAMTAFKAMKPQLEAGKVKKQQEELKEFKGNLSEGIKQQPLSAQFDQEYQQSQLILNEARTKAIIESNPELWAQTVQQAQEAVNQGADPNMVQQKLNETLQKMYSENQDGINKATAKEYDKFLELERKRQQAAFPYEQTLDLARNIYYNKVVKDRADIDKNAYYWWQDDDSSESFIQQAENKDYLRTKEKAGEPISTEDLYTVQKERSTFDMQALQYAYNQSQAILTSKQSTDEEKSLAMLTMNNVVKAMEDLSKLYPEVALRESRKNLLQGMTDVMDRGMTPSRPGKKYIEQIQNNFARSVIDYTASGIQAITNAPFMPFQNVMQSISNAVSEAQFEINEGIFGIPSNQQIPLYDNYTKIEIFGKKLRFYTKDDKVVDIRDEQGYMLYKNPFPAFVTPQSVYDQQKANGVKVSDFREDLLLPKLVRSGTDMGLLIFGANKLSGAFGTKGGLVLSGYALEYNNAYNALKEADPFIADNDAKLFAAARSALVASMELINPQSYLMGKTAMQEMTTNYIQLLRQGVTSKDALRQSLVFAKDIVDEGFWETVQEYSQEAGGKAFDEITNEVLNRPIMEVDWNADEMYELGVLTFATAGLFKAAAGINTNELEQNAIYTAVTKEDKFREYIQSELDNNKISQEDFYRITAIIDEAKLVINSLPAEMGDAVKSNILSLYTAKNQLQRKLNETINESSLKSIQEQINSIDTKIQAYTGINLPKYKIDGKAVLKSDIVSLIQDPKNWENIVTGKINVEVNNDSELISVLSSAWRERNNRDMAARLESRRALGAAPQMKALGAAPQMKLLGAAPQMKALGAAPQMKALGAAPQMKELPPATGKPEFAQKEIEPKGEKPIVPETYDATNMLYQKRDELDFELQNMIDQGGDEKIIQSIKDQIEEIDSKIKVTEGEFKGDNILIGLQEDGVSWNIGGKIYHWIKNNFDSSGNLVSADFITDDGEMSSVTNQDDLYDMSVAMGNYWRQDYANRYGYIAPQTIDPRSREARKLRKEREQEAGKTETQEQKLLRQEAAAKSKTYQEYVEQKRQQKAKQVQEQQAKEKQAVETKSEKAKAEAADQTKVITKKTTKPIYSQPLLFSKLLKFSPGDLGFLIKNAKPGMVMQDEALPTIMAAAEALGIKVPKPGKKGRYTYESVLEVLTELNNNNVFTGTDLYNAVKNLPPRIIGYTQEIETRTSETRELPSTQEFNNQITQYRESLNNLVEEQKAKKWDSNMSKIMDIVDKPNDNVDAVLQKLDNGDPYDDSFEQAAKDIESMISEIESINTVSVEDKGLILDYLYTTLDDIYNEKQKRDSITPQPTAERQDQGKAVGQGVSDVAGEQRKRTAEEQFVAERIEQLPEESAKQYRTFVSTEARKEEAIKIIAAGIQEKKTAKEITEEVVKMLPTNIQKPAQKKLEPIIEQIIYEQDKQKVLIKEEEPVSEKRELVKEQPVESQKQKEELIEEQEKTKPKKQIVAETTGAVTEMPIQDINIFNTKKSFIDYANKIIDAISYITQIPTDVLKNIIDTPSVMQNISQSIIDNIDLLRKNGFVIELKNGIPQFVMQYKSFKGFLDATGVYDFIKKINKAYGPVSYVKEIKKLAAPSEYKGEIGSLADVIENIKQAYDSKNESLVNLMKEYLENNAMELGAFAIETDPNTGIKKTLLFTDAIFEAIKNGKTTEEITNAIEKTKAKFETPQTNEDNLPSASLPNPGYQPNKLEFGANEANNVESFPGFSSDPLYAGNKQINNESITTYPEGTIQDEAIKLGFEESNGIAPYNLISLESKKKFEAKFDKVTLEPIIVNGQKYYAIYHGRLFYNPFRGQVSDMSEINDPQTKQFYQLQSDFTLHQDVMYAGSVEDQLVYMTMAGASGRTKAANEMQASTTLLKKSNDWNFISGVEKAKSSADVANIFRQLENESVEQFFVYMENAKGEQIGVHISSGTNTTVKVPVKNIIAAATQFGAKKIWHIHNHPDGSLEPSEHDLAVDAALKGAFDGMDIFVEDGIIMDLNSGQYTKYNSNTTLKTKDATFSSALEYFKANKNNKQNLRALENLGLNSNDMYPVETYTFSPRIFSSAAVMKRRIISGNQDVAYFSGILHTGSGRKYGFIVTNNRGNVVGVYYGKSLFDPNVRSAISSNPDAHTVYPVTNDVVNHNQESINQLQNYYKIINLNTPYLTTVNGSSIGQQNAENKTGQISPQASTPNGKEPRDIVLNSINSGYVTIEEVVFFALEELQNKQDVIDMYDNIINEYSDLYYDMPDEIQNKMTNPDGLSNVNIYDLLDYIESPGTSSDPIQQELQKEELTLRERYGDFADWFENMHPDMAWQYRITLDPNEGPIISYNGVKQYSYNFWSSTQAASEWYKNGRQKFLGKPGLLSPDQDILPSVPEHIKLDSYDLGPDQVQAVNLILNKFLTESGNRIEKSLPVIWGTNWAETISQYALGLIQNLNFSNSDYLKAKSKSEQDLSTGIKDFDLSGAFMSFEDILTKQMSKTAEFAKEIKSDDEYIAKLLDLVKAEIDLYKSIKDKSKVTFYSKKQLEKITEVYNLFKKSFNDGNIKYEPWFKSGAFRHKGFVLADGPGTGKTRIQLVAANEIYKRTGKPVIIIMDSPKARLNFENTAKVLGIPLDEIEFNKETTNGKPRIIIGTYGDLNDNKLGLKKSTQVTAPWNDENINNKINNYDVFDVVKLITDQEAVYDNVNGKTVKIKDLINASEMYAAAASGWDNLFKLITDKLSGYVFLNKTIPGNYNDVKKVFEEFLYPIPLESKPYSAIIFDEAHKLKNLGQSQVSNKAFDIVNQKTDNVVYATATPNDKPTNALYWIAQLIEAPPGSSITEKSQLAANLIGFKKGGLAWKDIIKKFKELRLEFVKNGSFLRRELPFWGSVEQIFNEPEPVLGLDLYEGQELIMESIGNARLRALQLQMWTQLFKAPSIIKQLETSLSQGRQVAILVPYVNELKVTGYYGEDGPRHPNATKIFIDYLEKNNIPYSELYGASATQKNQAIADFQSGKNKVILFTAESGGVGIDLDDQSGKARRDVLVVSLPWAGDVYDQFLYRFSRRNTKSPVRILFFWLDNAEADIKKIGVISNKIAVVKSIQNGQDPIDVETAHWSQDVDSDEYIEDPENPEIEASAPSNKEGQSKLKNNTWIVAENLEQAKSYFEKGYKVYYGTEQDVNLIQAQDIYQLENNFEYGNVFISTQLIEDNESSDGLINLGDQQSEDDIYASSSQSDDFLHDEIADQGSALNTVHDLTVDPIPWTKRSKLAKWLFGSKTIPYTSKSVRRALKEIGVPNVDDSHLFKRYLGMYFDANKSIRNQITLNLFVTAHEAMHWATLAVKNINGDTIVDLIKKDNNQNDIKELTEIVKFYYGGKVDPKDVDKNIKEGLACIMERSFNTDKIFNYNIAKKVLMPGGKYNNDAINKVRNIISTEFGKRKGLPGLFRITSSIFYGREKLKIFRPFSWNWWSEFISKRIDEGFLADKIDTLYGKNLLKNKDAGFGAIKTAYYLWTQRNAMASNVIGVASKAFDSLIGSLPAYYAGNGQFATMKYTQKDLTNELERLKKDALSGKISDPAAKEISNTDIDIVQAYDSYLINRRMYATYQERQSLEQKFEDVKALHNSNIEALKNLKGMTVAQIRNAYREYYKSRVELYDTIYKLDEINKIIKNDGGSFKTIHPLLRVLYNNRSKRKRSIKKKIEHDLEVINFDGYKSDGLYDFVKPYNPDYTTTELSENTTREVYDKYNQFFATADEMFDSINKDMVKMSLATGLITAEEANKYIGRFGYARFMRHVDNVIFDENSIANILQKSGTSGGSTIAAFKRRTGSERGIISPIFGQSLFISETYKKGFENLFLNRIANLSKSHGDSYLGINFQEIKSKVIFKEEKKYWSDIAEKKYEKVFPEALGLNNYVEFRVNGKRVRYEIKDPELFNLINNVNGNTWATVSQSLENPLIKALISVARWFQMSTTQIYPFWAGSNYSVDLVSRYMNTKGGQHWGLFGLGSEGAKGFVKGLKTGVVTGDIANLFGKNGLIHSAVKTQILKRTLYTGNTGISPTGGLNKQAKLLDQIHNIVVGGLSARQVLVAQFQKQLGRMPSVSELNYLQQYLSLQGANQTLVASFFLDDPNQFINKLGITADSPISGVLKYLIEKAGGKPDTVYTPGKTEVKVSEGIDTVLDFLSLPTNITEILGRLNQYKLAKMNGKTDEEALFLASEVSIPFWKRGSNKNYLVYASMLPYFRSLINTVYKFYGNVQTKEGANRTAVAILSLTTISAIMTYLLYDLGDEEEKYFLKNLSNDERAQYLFIPMALFGGKGYQKFRIPQEVGIYKAMTELVIISMMENKQIDKDQIYDMAMKALPDEINPLRYIPVLSPDLQTAYVKGALKFAPYMVSGPMSVAFNLTGYPTARPLVSTKIGRFEEYLQYDERDLKLSVELSSWLKSNNIMDVSPKVINHLLRHYGGRSVFNTLSYLDENDINKFNVYNVTRDQILFRGYQFDKFYEEAESTEKKYNSMFTSRNPNRPLPFDFNDESWIENVQLNIANKHIDDSVKDLLSLAYNLKMSAISLKGNYEIPENVTVPIYRIMDNRLNIKPKTDLEFADYANQITDDIENAYLNLYDYVNDNDELKQALKGEGAWGDVMQEKNLVAFNKSVILAKLLAKQEIQLLKERGVIPK